MKKLLLCAFVVLTPLVSCSSDDNQEVKKDNSFSHKIKSLKAYDYQLKETTSTYTVDANSKVSYIENENVIELVIISKGQPATQSFNITSKTDNQFYCIDGSDGSKTTLDFIFTAGKVEMKIYYDKVFVNSVVFTVE